MKGKTGHGIAAVLALVVFGLSFFAIDSKITVGDHGDFPEFHIDEAHKIGEAYYWHLMFEKRDIGNRAWAEDFYARTNPPVGKYLFGAVLSANGLPVRDSQLQQDFERLWRESEALRHRVPDRMLLLTRRTSAFFGALSAAFLFLACYLHAGLCAGIMAPVLFLAHPFIINLFRIGSYDSICVSFVLLFVLACYGIRKKFSFLKSVLLPSIVISLALGTKMNSFVLVPCYVIFIFLTVFDRSEWPVRRARSIGVFVITSGMTLLLSLFGFMAINPLYYGNPFGKFAEMLRISGDWTIKQQIEPGGGLFSLAEKISVVGTFTLKSGELPLARLLGTTGCLLGILFFLVGISAMIHGSRDEAADVRAKALMSWVLVSLAGTVLWLPLDWTRYLVIPYAAVCIATSIGVGEIAGLARRPIRRGAMWMAVPVSVLWAILGLTHWIVDPALLNPAIAGAAPRIPDGAAIFPLPEGKGRNAYLIDQNRGYYFLQRDEKEVAGLYLERSLSLLERADGGVVSLAVRRAVLHYLLADIHAGTGDSPGAIRLLREHVKDLRTVAGGMTTADRKIIDEYDRLIADREADIRELMGRQR